MTRALPLHLALLALLAAPIACGEPAAAPAAPAVDRLSLRLSSYNAWLLPLASQDLGDRVDRMPAALDALAPDVLCLQEAWLPFQRDALESGLEHRLPYATYGGGGLALLSRFPIAEERYHPFEDDEALSMVERLGNKGVFEVVLDTPGGPLRVLDSHLALDRSGGGGHGRQVAQLRAHMAARPELPTVVCADLNMRATRDGALVPAYASLLAAGYADTIPPMRKADGRYLPRPTTRVGWPRATRRGRGWSPDFVFVRGGASGAGLRATAAAIALDDAATALSDHNLLQVDLVLTRPGATE
ncbi:MAG: hypothetical protein EP329_01425 [Deltaproteobacteria bacterium]|nr:MAG: hypothetical protein EP329_01425 [Deltaproteobacteria bacterium]